MGQKHTSCSGKIHVPTWMIERERERESKREKESVIFMTSTSPQAATAAAAPAVVVAAAKTNNIVVLLEERHNRPIKQILLKTSIFFQSWQLFMFLSSFELEKP